MVSLQSVRQDHHIVVAVSERSVEGASALIVAAHHHIDLRHVALGKPFLTGADHGSTVPEASGFGANRDVAHPPAVAVVANHRGRKEGLAFASREHGRGLAGERAPEIAPRVVPRSRDSDLVPQVDGGVELNR